MNRRFFLKNATTAGLGITILPGWASAMAWPENELREQLPDAIIKSVRLVQWQKKLFVAVTDADNITGMTICNVRMEHLSGIFNGLVAPFFVNKNAADIARLVDDVYKDERNYKYSGMPFWNCVGHVEVAIWDLLGKKAAKPVHALLGVAKRKALPMYLSSLTRDNTAQQETDKILSALHSTGCKAVKVKVGGRMGTDAQAEKRSTEIVQLIRKNASGDLTLYADANGSFDVLGGIKMGKFLQDMGVDIFEEPCPWEDVESNQKVNAALHKIKLAGGEQDTSYFRFEWYAKKNGLDVLQPDTFYNGGIIRTLRIAELCKQYKKHFAPHSPKADPLEAPFLHLISVAPAVYGFQEFPLSGVNKKHEHWWGPHYQLENGTLQVNEQPGLGIYYDELILKEAITF